MSNFQDNIVNRRFNAIFYKLLETHKIKSKSDIAAKLGTYNHIINNILKGERNVTIDQLNKLIELYDINANYVFGCSKDMFHNDDSSSDIAEYRSEPKRNITLIPHTAMAGNSLDIERAGNESDFEKFAIPGIQGDMIAIEITGDSMLPNITNGDIVICEPIDLRSGIGSIKDNAVYIVVTDAVVAKRVQKIRNGANTVGLRLISDNSIYPPYDVDGSELRQIFKVKYRLTDYGIN